MKKLLLFLSAAVVGSGMLLANPMNRTELPESSKFVMYTPGEGVVSPDNYQKAPEKAEEERFVDFTYAMNPPVNAYSLKGINSGFVYIAFQIPVEDQTPYIGCSISALNITAPATSTGSNTIRFINVFVTEDLSVVPETTKAQLDKVAFSENVITLPEPYVITGEKPIYVGYRFRYVSNVGYLPTDDVPTPTTQRSCLVGNATSTSVVPTYANYSDQIGSICMGARITGDNLPENKMQVSAISMSSQWYAPDTPVQYSALVKNIGANQVENVTIKTSISSGDECEKDITFETPLNCGETREIIINDVPNTGEGILTLSATPVKVNGLAMNGNTSTASFTSYENGYPRRIVVEEATGNWCGYCPRGIVMMDYLAEKYPDWIRIGVHGGSNSEPMLVPGYSPWFNTYVSGFPNAIANRMTEVPVMAHYGQYYAPIDAYYTSFPAYVKVNLSTSIAEDGSSVEVTSTTTFAFNTDVPHKLTYVIVEDNVGPYDQTNYYYGEAVDLNGWQNNDGKNTMFNDVARAIDGYDGLPDAFPATLEKNNPYTYSRTLPLSYPNYGIKPDKTTGTEINPTSARVVALVTNAVTGEIVNAGEVKMGESYVDGLNSVNVKVNVRVENGSIVVDGVENFSVYSLDGRKVDANNVSSGLYIVKAAGKSFKILVK